MGFALDEPLLPKPAVSSKARLWACSYAVPAAVALVCVVVGTLHPLAAEAAKSAKLTTCRAGLGGVVHCGQTADEAAEARDERQAVMPFYKVTLTIAAEITSVFVSATAVALQEGSAHTAAQKLLRSEAVLRLWPIGAAYGIGDLLQTFACDSASAPVVLVIGQCKLLLTAVLSMLVLGHRTPPQWPALYIITLAAIAGANNGAAIATSQVAKDGEVRGALLALLKAGLSSSGAVFSERFFKEEGESFWVMSFRVQLMMLTTSLVMFLIMGAGEAPRSLADFFGGGPEALCAGPDRPCEPAALLGPGNSGECRCLDRVGWDWLTVLAMMAIVLNGLVTGLTLKHLSAVGKAVCNALSIAVFYPAYLVLGFNAFDLTQAAIIGVIIVASYQYSTEKARHSTRTHRREAILRVVPAIRPWGDE